MTSLAGGGVGVAVTSYGGGGVSGGMGGAVTSYGGVGVSGGGGVGGAVSSLQVGGAAVAGGGIVSSFRLIRPGAAITNAESAVSASSYPTGLSFETDFGCALIAHVWQVQGRVHCNWHSEGHPHRVRNGSRLPRWVFRPVARRAYLYSRPLPPPPHTSARTTPLLLLPNPASPHHTPLQYHWCDSISRPLLFLRQPIQAPARTRTLESARRLYQMLQAHYRPDYLYRFHTHRRRGALDRSTCFVNHRQEICLYRPTQRIWLPISCLTLSKAY